MFFIDDICYNFPRFDNTIIPFLLSVNRFFIALFICLPYDALRDSLVFIGLNPKICRYNFSFLDLCSMDKKMCGYHGRRPPSAVWSKTQYHIWCIWIMHIIDIVYSNCSIVAVKCISTTIDRNSIMATSHRIPMIVYSSLQIKSLGIWHYNQIQTYGTFVLIIIVYFPKNYTWYVHYKHKNTSHTSHAHVTEEWLCNGWEGCQKKLAFIELAAWFLTTLLFIFIQLNHWCKLIFTIY